MIVLADETQNEGDNTTWTVWAVKKGTNRTEDRVHKRYSKTANIKLTTINGVEYKAVELPINESFSEEVYFIVRCEGRPYKVIDLSAENQTDDVVNVSVAPGDIGSSISWERVKNNIAVMLLVGRESIKSLSDKIDKVNADSSAYVKHSETTDGTGQEQKSGKVLKLGNDGKINKAVLPAIAINEFISVSAAAWGEGALNGKEFQNGDIIFHEQTQKRYLCINKDAANFNDRFIELNSKDGTVTSVEGKIGAVTLNIALEDNKFKLKINGTGGTETVKEIEMISDDEIDSIINGLPN